MKRHPLDLFSLITGLSFVAVAVLYLLDAAGQIGVDGRLVIPLVLVSLGVAGLAAAIHRMARGQRESAQPSRAPEPPYTPEPGSDHRYDELTPDLEALGLLDEPTPKKPE